MGGISAYRCVLCACLSFLIIKIFKMRTAKIRVCTCKQCRAAKKNKSTNLKKKIKRLINKRRRTIFCDVVKTYYWS